MNMLGLVEYLVRFCIDILSVGAFVYPKLGEGSFSVTRERLFLDVNFL